MDPEAPGTMISNDTEKGKIKAVAAKDNITAIKIKSSRMLLAHGSCVGFRDFRELPDFHRYGVYFGGRCFCFH
jgi:hypothetical protein